MRSRRLLLILIALSSAASARAGFTNLGPAQDYNTFVFRDNTQYGTDAEGRVAVGGNALFDQNFQGYTVASSKPTGSAYNLVVGGNYTNRYNTVNGSIFVGGDASPQGPTIKGDLIANGNINLNPGGNTGGTVQGNVQAHGAVSNNGVTISGTTTSGAPAAVSPIDFTLAESQLKALSADLASQLQTPGAAVTFNFNNLKLIAPTGVDYVVFHITNTQLATMNDFELKADPLTTVVINVDDVGTHADSFHNNGMSIVGTTKQYVLFNFHEATSLVTNGIGINGSVLAPYADVNFASGNIDGTLIARSLSGNGEAHDFAFQGTLVPSVPEPSSIALTGIGALGGLLVFRRRRAA